MRAEKCVPTMLFTCKEVCREIIYLDFIAFDIFCYPASVLDHDFEARKRESGQKNRFRVPYADRVMAELRGLHSCH